MEEFLDGLILTIDLIILVLIFIVFWAGLILIFLGVGILIAEMFLPTFGVSGVV